MFICSRRRAVTATAGVHLNSDAVSLVEQESQGRRRSRRRTKREARKRRVRRMKRRRGRVKRRRRELSSHYVS